VLYGIIFQIVLIFVLMKFPICISGVEYIAGGIMKLKDATLEGTKFVFGYIGGDVLPFDVADGRSPFVFAFQALPTVIITGALAAILTYLKIFPIIAKAIGYAFKKVFRVNETVGIITAAKIFVGQIEAPLLVKHRLPSLRENDMFIILALAFATTSAATMPIYAGALDGICQDAMKHILMSSVVSVISVHIICPLMMHGNGTDDIKTAVDHEPELPYSSFMGAMSKGISDGAFVWWCIVGSLVGTVALIALINYLLGLFPDVGGESITLQKIFGVCMYPFAWLLDVAPKDVMSVSQVLGTKTAVNELVAFFDLAKANLDSGSATKAIYALNNYGNFACIGITIGGISALVPSQKCIASLAWKAFWAGLLATGLTAMIMSVFLDCLELV
jgi:CNT family concentrative nucleoside transporter